MGVAAGSIHSSLALLVGVRHGVGAAGLTSAGSAVGLLLSVLVERRHLITSLRTRSRLSAMMSLLALGVIGFAPWWVAPLAMCAMGLFPMLVSTALLHEQPAGIPSGSAMKMAGSMVSLSIGGVLARLGTTPVLLFAAIALALTATIRGSGTSSQTPDISPQEKASRLWVFPFLLALTAYGPLMLFATLVSLELSSVWIGPAAAAYTLGSFVAGRLLVGRDISPAKCALLAALASSVWIVGFSSVPVMLLMRFVSGVALFIAQGAALSRSSRLGTKADLAASLVALSIGAQLGGVWAGQAAELSVPFMAMLATSLALCLAIGLWFAQRLSHRSDLLEPLTQP